ncbi:trypsin I-P1-like [Daphnia carinata]|uniref:trypsin I-P1-like n=1 Tax=Daphnia carinata TaxID=120202 RepID=UPI00257FB77D|nr:trypsin I-P1-like [Daphnia carinata]
MKLTALLATLFFALTAGAPNEDRIYGGAQATAAVPYLASIVANQQHICGGWIYEKDWIVTAANCVYNYLPSELSVIVGQYSLIQPDVEEEVINVFKIYIYSGYNNATLLHDIAMLQLATPMTFGTYVNYLPYEEADEMSGATGTFSGWGGTLEGNLPSTKLRTMTVDFPGDCSGYTQDEYSQNYMLCAGTAAATSSPCHYDEGSPLVQTIGGVDYAVGIMSKNKGCGAAVPSTIYTRLTAYYAWFNEIAGLQPPPATGNK